MKTLAEVKRRLVVGAKVTTSCPAFGWDNIERTVMIKQSNAVAFTNPRDVDRVSWLYWPKASEVRVEGDSFVVLSFDGNEQNNMTYTFVEGQS